MTDLSLLWRIWRDTYRRARRADDVLTAAYFAALQALSTEASLSQAPTPSLFVPRCECSSHSTGRPVTEREA